MYKCLNHFQISRPARAPRFVQLNNGLGIHIPELIPFDPEVYFKCQFNYFRNRCHKSSIGRFIRTRKQKRPFKYNCQTCQIPYRGPRHWTGGVSVLRRRQCSSATKKTFNRHKDYSIKKEEINRQNSLVRHMCSLLTSVDKGFNWKLFMGC